MTDETVTIELTERQLGWIEDALRWQIETARDKGLNRNARKMGRVRREIDEQTGDENANV